MPAVPEMIGGSADLTGSNNTRTKSMKVCRPPTIPAASSITASASTAWRGHERHGAAWRHHSLFGGTFLVFSDYCRPAIRLAALMGERVIM
jgi:transketolase